MCAVTDITLLIPGLEFDEYIVILNRKDGGPYGHMHTETGRRRVDEIDRHTNADIILWQIGIDGLNRGINREMEQFWRSQQIFEIVGIIVGCIGMLDNLRGHCILADRHMIS